MVNAGQIWYRKAINTGGLLAILQDIWAHSPQDSQASVQNGVLENHISTYPHLEARVFWKTSEGRQSESEPELSLVETLD